jgi:hypothetical protein
MVTTVAERWERSFRAASLLNRPQEVAEGEVSHALPVIPRYFVGSAEVDSLVDADIDHVVRHI